MCFTTKIRYIGPYGTPRTKITQIFKDGDSFETIFKWIAQWRKHDSFSIEIKDQDDEFVDFDEDYLTDFKPYHVDERTDECRVQPTTSTPPVVELRLQDSPSKIASLNVDFFLFV